MTRDEIFAVWAPPNCDWSAWVKPVLFAYVGDVDTLTSLPVVSTDWAPVSDGRTALVLDLPAARSVFYAAALAPKGFRPVPLYNAQPGPTVGLGVEPSAALHTVCDVEPIVRALEAATPILRSLRLSPAAPPAFLLDSDRRVGRRPQPDMFDNRSVSLPTDFPTANLLIAHGIQRALLVQEDSFEPQVDVARTLFLWQQAGITIEAVSLGKATQVRPIRVRKPPIFKLIALRLLATFGLKRSPLSGFGGVHPGPHVG